MSQPQLELPQISFARYLDLLRRRRWQVIPVSLLGLLIGGCVAFLIPRYYVADTMLEYYRPPGDLSPEGSVENPFARAVSSARYTLPLVAGDTMKQLGWDEVATTDTYELRQNTRAVEQRVNVIDQTQGGRDAGYAQMIVTYRDRDGRRSAEFLNTLCELWKDQQLKDLNTRALAQKRQKTDKFNNVIGEYDKINENLEALSQRWGFQRALSEQMQRDLYQLWNTERQVRDKTRLELAGGIKRLETAIAQATTELDQTPVTQPSATIDLDTRYPPGSPVRNAYDKLEWLQEQLEIYGNARTDRRAVELMIEKAQKKLAELTGFGGDGPVNPVNPRRAELNKQIEANRKELADKQGQLAVLGGDTEASAAEEAQRRQAETEFVRKMADLKIAEASKQRAQEDLDLANDVLGKLTLEPPIKFRLAGVPPAPTEPNVLVVAGLGCLVGLGVAIGLILMVDVLQGTFKTVDDVERALPVPVLGAMSHMETEEQRRRVVSGRRRASLLAGAFLFSAVIVITVYYTARERLPAVARDLLSLVLGG